MGSISCPGAGLDIICMSRFGAQENIRAVPIFVTELNFTERAPQPEHEHCQTGERGPR